MSISIFKRPRGGKEQIDIQEAFNIWNLLKARYLSAQTVQLFNNFVHDRDLSIVLNTLLDHFKEQITILENYGKKFHITLPKRPPLDIKFAKQKGGQNRFLFSGSRLLKLYFMPL
jgi:hypothetical protein